MPDVANAQTLWLAARIENSLGNRQGASELGDAAAQPFPGLARSRGLFARGAFDE